jgi:hypothetical protein
VNATRNFLNKVTQHGLSYKVIGDDAIFQRAHDFYFFGRSAVHFARRPADFDDGRLVLILANGYNGWLLQDNTSSLLVNKDVYGTQINGYIWRD